jgi:hypothetical protein
MVNETYTPEYQAAIDNLLSLIEDMKASGDYHNETLEEIEWRMS